MAEVGPANAIPDMLAPKRTIGKSDKIGEEEVGDRLEKLFPSFRPERIRKVAQGRTRKS